jgi:hypothetical protein
MTISSSELVTELRDMARELEDHAFGIGRPVTEQGPPNLQTRRRTELLREAADRLEAHENATNYVNAWL